MRIELKFAGDVQVQREILRVSERASTAAPAFAVIWLRLMNITENQFESQGRRGSGGWQPLKPATLERKVRLGLDPRILFATHRLYESLTRVGHPDQVLEIGHDEMRFGSNVPYYEFHQRGRGVPRRAPLELSARDRREIVKDLQAWIIRGIIRNPGLI